METILEIKSKTFGLIKVRIDLDDMENINRFKWRIHKTRLGKMYAITNLPRVKGKRNSLYMHRLIIGGNSKAIDHINGDTLDNRKINLRPATQAQNQMNKGAQKNSSTGIKGVCPTANGNKYRASIKANGKIHHLGTFANIEEAASVYDDAAKRFFGEFARLNKEKP